MRLLLKTNYLRKVNWLPLVLQVEKVGSSNGLDNVYINTPFRTPIHPIGHPTYLIS
jgi:hypothetical protein